MPGGDILFKCKVCKAGERGIDGVIQDERPIVGQKIVFQAKNYTSNHDQLAIVKAFATTVKEQKAHKGILVTTMKSFSAHSQQVAEENLIELVTAGQFKGWMDELGFQGDLSEAAREERRKEVEKINDARHEAKRQKKAAAAASAGAPGSSAAPVAAANAAGSSADVDDDTE